MEGNEDTELDNNYNENLITTVISTKKLGWKQLHTYGNFEHAAKQTTEVKVMVLYLVGQVNHTEVGLQLKAERGQGRGTSVGPGELVEYNGIFRVQLFFLSVWERMKELLFKHSHLLFY